MKELKMENISYKSEVSLFHRWRIIDSIQDFTAIFNEQTIYGIVGALGSGGWLLSHLLCGRSNELFINNPSITIDGLPVNNALLQSLSCYVGEGVAEAPYKNLSRYPNYLSRRLNHIKTVSEHLRQGIKSTDNNISIHELANMFDLSGLDENNMKKGRINRPLEFQSGEVWRASLAIGMAYQKKLFCFPWLEPDYLLYTLSSHNCQYINLLKKNGASVIIPVSNVHYVKGLADEIIYLKKPEIMF
ncbi:hypothetical protein PAESOLCIP111_00005 [Paenibacillus solanacearum]|uniref:Uncharacterized protein n=1 Tax=Paenibacillus solanacearum TaxID=2048548 RepID=A0A916JQU0_9BACL|nr:hypothetical protein [Paenibacillus solanacearum]CAG7594672.1 hypothetical protein PAESOLCIP111_00005 [Paenibacillus solanacearum]